MRTDTSPSPTGDPSVIRAIGFAHELANGLASIRLNLYFALEELKDNAVHNAALEALLRAALAEAHIQFIEAINLVSVFHPELVASLDRPERLVVSPSAVLQEVLPMYVHRAANRGIEFHVEGLGTGLPKQRLDVSVLRRVFHNVLSNAVKYSFGPAAGGQRFIRIQELRPDALQPWWVMRIENYGVGVTQDEVRKIFIPGYRGILARGDNIHGAGIGLGEAKRCMESLGGRFRLQSKQVNADAFRTSVSLVFRSE